MHLLCSGDDTFGRVAKQLRAADVMAIFIHRDDAPDICSIVAEATNLHLWAVSKGELRHMKVIRRLRLASFNIASINGKRVELAHMLDREKLILLHYRRPEEVEMIGGFPYQDLIVWSRWLVLIKL